MAVDCASGVFDADQIAVLRKETVPQCYVIKENSPAIFHSRTNNYFPVMSSDGVVYSILGLYTPANHTIYLVENVDILETYRHECQHHMFRVLGIEILDSGSTVHTHEIWNQCEDAYYEPSEKARKAYKNRKLTKEDILMNALVKHSLAGNRLIWFNSN